MSDSDLRAKGRAMRRTLVGDVCADKLDKEVYTDPHMEKFAELTQEWLFAQMWTRPGLDLKTRSLITMISDVSTGMSEALGLHVRFCRIHGWSVAAGVAAVQGGEKAGKDIPDFILADGPVITKETAPGHLWLQKNFLI